MFSKGDKVVHCPEGVCVIEDIVKMKIEKEEKDFYMLRSTVDPGNVIYVSVHAENSSMRTLKSREEVEALLQMNPEADIYMKQNNQKRANIQKQAILGDDSRTVMKLIKLYKKRKEMYSISVGDNQWLGDAERFLFSEMSEVLGCELT